MRIARGIAYVTGAAKGIGRGIAGALADDGYDLALLDIDEENGAAAAAEFSRGGTKAVFHSVDVSSSESVERAFAAAAEALGAASVLVNCAGVWAGGSVTEISMTDWDYTMAVNVRGTFLACRAVLPTMVTARAGAIVNISSIAGLKGTRRAGAYNASKAAVIALTKNLAVDYAPHGIRANAVCPGLIGGTDMDQQLRDFRGDTPEYQEAVVALHPLGRLGQPEDVARAVVFLAGSGSSWTTGAAMVVDGGAMTGY